MIFLILQLSLMRGKVPSSLKDANVTPLLKDPNKSKNFYTNWRPIAVTSIVARVMERVVASRLIRELELAHVPRNIQFGGRKNRGTEDALAYTFMGIKKSVEQNGCCHAVFCDISKAFDRVDPDLLILKLMKKGVSDVLVLWIYDFLTRRRQRVKIGSDFSSWSVPKSGIPQGTVLGPILWAVFIDDCPIEIQTQELERGCLFVDDMAIYSSGSEKD